MPEHTIAENLQRLQTAKTAIGNAITAKGGTVGANDGLEEFASDIATIPSGGVDFKNSPVSFALTTNIDNLDVIVPNGITSIASSGFLGCNGLKSIIISEGVTVISGDAFRNCSSLETVTFPSTLYGLNNYAFTNCTSLKSISLPRLIHSIGNYAFSGCTQLSSVTLPSELQTIGSGAFGNCSSIKNLEIPQTVTDINTVAFEKCTSLETLKFYPTSPPTLGVNAFRNLPTTCIIYVPTGSLAAYTSAANYPDSNTYTYVEY